MATNPTVTVRITFEDLEHIPLFQMVKAGKLRLEDLSRINTVILGASEDGEYGPGWVNVTRQTLPD